MKKVGKSAKEVCELTKELEEEEIAFQQANRKLKGLPKHLKIQILGQWFWDRKMKRLGATKEMAEELNYTKILDYADNKFLLYKNEAVVEFSLAVLKKNKKNIYKYKSALLSNFMFIVRVVVYHIILVSLANSPIAASLVMLVVEMLYLIFNIKIFKKLKSMLFT